MNGKKAKAQRRQQRATEVQAQAFQQHLRKKPPVASPEVGVIATTPRTPDVDPEALANEVGEAAAIEQEVKIGLIQQNAKHYSIGDELSLTRGDAFKAASPELLLGREVTDGFKEPIVKYFDGRITSGNGPVSFTNSKGETVTSKFPFKLADMHGDRGVICHVDPDVPVDDQGRLADIVLFDRRKTLTDYGLNNHEGVATPAEVRANLERVISDANKYLDELGDTVHPIDLASTQEIKELATARLKILDKHYPVQSEQDSVKQDKE